VHRSKTGPLMSALGQKRRRPSARVRSPRPFCPKSGQTADRLGMSAWCQKATFALQQIFLFDHLVSAPEQRDRKSFPLLVDYGCAARSAARTMRLTFLIAK